MTQARTLTLADFLLARIVEDEAVYREAGQLLFTEERLLAECEAKRRIIALHHVECGGHPGSFMPHADYGPGYCWREDESNETLLALASIYADHPDYPTN